MSDLNLSISGKKRLLTQGKYCDKNIVITADGMDAFWDSFQLNGTRANYPYTFAGSGWTDETYNPKYEIVVTTGSANGTFHLNSQITSTKVPITIDAAGWSQQTFNGCSSLKTIPSLKVTEKIQNYGYWFDGCKSLEEINFTEDSVIAKNIAFPDSSLLTAASVDSIINALKDLTGGTAQTLTFHATVGGNLTEEQKAAVTAKNWTLVY